MTADDRHSQKGDTKELMIFFLALIFFQQIPHVYLPFIFCVVCILTFFQVFRSKKRSKFRIYSAEDLPGSNPGVLQRRDIIK